MKNSGWVVYLFSNEEKKELIKIMEFKTIKHASEVLGIPSQTISNYHHGLIRPRGILKKIMLFQSLAMR